MAQRGRAARTATLLVALTLLGACAANGPRPQPQAGTSGSPASGEPRSTRGNPPFYDVLGKRYHVLRTSAGYKERGVASWYGPDFHGLATSSGETYDMHAMTAAHTTLPIPTWVEVTNLTNGRRVAVRVNDRGPFVDNRIIDLSFAAATALDMVRNGTARVEVRAIPPPGAPPVVTASATPVPAGVLGLPGVVAAAPQPEQRMFVQAGAFSQHGNALRLVEQLRAGGFVDPVIVNDAGRGLHLVRLGPIRDSQEFDRLRARLRGVGVADARLVVDQ